MTERIPSPFRQAESIKGKERDASDNECSHQN